MDEVKTSKTVKEVFKDYNSNSFVLNAARVIGIDLYKKKNLLEVFIASNKLIDINDVLELEKYMERRFQIQTAKLTIKYELEEEVDVSEKIAKEQKYEFENGYILVNENTASASELTAGALQSEKGYQLVGTTTYGKGSAQTQKTLSDGSVLKYTYAKWMIPNGTCINGKGLTPDIEVENVSLDGISTKDVKETLKVDCVNTRIKSMQKMLNILGYSADREDGYFSVATQDALKKFEADNDLTVDGEYSQNDKQMMIARMMIYINNHENDKQYEYLMKIIK